MELELQDNSGAQYRSRVILGQPEKPKMLSFILKTGIVKTEQAAANVLIALVVLIFGVSIFLFIQSDENNGPTPQITYPDGTKSPDVN